MTEIAMGFVLIAALILWFIIGSKGHWGIKASMILLSLYFCLSVGFSIAGFMGWPTDDKLPSKFLLHWVVIQEPDVKLGDEGSIYIWVRPINEPGIEHKEWNDYLLSFYDGKSRPRAYRMPYSRELHEQAQKAIDAISRGEGVGGINGTDEKKGRGKESGKGKGSDKAGDGGRSLTNNGGIEFHKLPPPKLPDKDGY
jgi:hypothetical protein